LPEPDPDPDPVLFVGVDDDVAGSVLVLVADGVDDAVAVVPAGAESGLASPLGTTILNQVE